MLKQRMVGLGRFELPTPRLSSVCSNQLSYRPVALPAIGPRALNRATPILSKLDRTTRALATPNLMFGATPPGQCPDAAKNQIDLRVPGARLLKSLERR